MQTQSKPRHRILNSSFTPLSTLCSSNVSSNYDLDRDDNNSLSKKKFNRKRQGSNDNLNRFKAYQTDKKINKKQNIQIQQNIEISFQKAGKLLQKLSFTKSPQFQSKCVKIQTEGSQYQNQLPPINNSLIPPIRRGSRTKTQQIQITQASNIDYKLQLYIKDNEFLILQDENSRLKKQLKNKQTQIKKLEKPNRQAMSQYDGKIRELVQKIKTLQSNITKKDECLEQIQKVVIKGKQQLRKAQNQVQRLKIHVEQLMNRKLPKNTLQVISYRQMSLQNQIIQLKEQLGQTKCERSTRLQQQLHSTQEKLIYQTQNNSNLLIANRILVKKNNQTKMSVQKRFKLQIISLKQKLKSQIKQLSSLKKQNFNLNKSVYEFQKKIQNNKSLILMKGNQKRTNRLWTTIKKMPQNDSQVLSDDSFTFSLY